MDTHTPVKKSRKVHARLVDDTPLTLAEQLKQKTTTVHESLDKRIIRAKPFNAEENYLGFLKMQLCFHWLVKPLFSDISVQELLGPVANGCRYQQVVQDCLDLGISLEQQAVLLQSISPLAVSPLQAVGWIYTIEGSNIGGAFLFKMAKKMGLNERRGAQHLSGHMDGRAQHWRDVKRRINQLQVNDDQREQVIAGARDAFSFVRSKVEEFLPACA